MSLEGTERFSIGEVARMFRVSVSTLRHYEKIGLLAPEYVDPATGYRSYSTRQFECLNTIRYLRALEMPLEQIRDFLQDREVGKIQGMLLQQRQAVIQKRQALGIVQRKIENRLRQIQDALEGPLEEVRLVELPARRVAWLRDELAPKTYLDLEHSIRRLEAPAQEAVAFLGKVGVGLSLQRLWQGNYLTGSFSCWIGRTAIPARWRRCRRPLGPRCGFAGATARQGSTMSGCWGSAGSVGCPPWGLPWRSP